MYRQGTACVHDVQIVIGVAVKSRWWKGISLRTAAGCCKPGRQGIVSAVLLLIMGARVGMEEEQGPRGM